MKTFHLGNKNKTHFVRHNSPFWIFIHNIQSFSEDRFFSLESGWAFQLSAKNFNARFARGTKYTAVPKYEPRWLSSVHNFLQILNILVIKSSYSINNIMHQSFYPLAMYAFASDRTSSIRTALGLANHEPKKIN